MNPEGAADAGRRYRANPTPEQAERLTEWGHTCRAVWNLALAQRQFAWRQRGMTIRAAQQCRDLTEARADLSWLADLPAQSAQQILRQLDRAYDNWWNPEHSAGAPTFRRRGAGLSVPFPGQAVAVRKLSRRWAEVRLPKVGWVRSRLSRPLGGQLRNATVSRDGLGWHVSFGVATGAQATAANGLPGCGVDFGVDFGVACSAFVSDETEPRLMPASLTPGEQRRLLGLERRKARQIRWAKRYNGGRYSYRLRRTIAEVAKLRARQARRRLNFTHKLTTDLAKHHGWVAVEDLRVKSMTHSAQGTAESPGRNVRAKSGLNRSVLDNTPGERRRQLTYKAAGFGSELRVVPAPGTSQTCSACGVRDPGSRQGCGREFACTSCGHQAHADWNAARNIELLAAGQADSSTRSHLKVQGPPGAACVNHLRALHERHRESLPFGAGRMSRPDPHRTTLVEG